MGWKIIQEIAKVSFFELAASLAFAAVTCLFVATLPGAIALVITALAIFALNTFIRLVGGAFQFGVQRIDSEKAWSHKFCKGGATVCNYIAPTTFAFYDSTTRDVLIHETGHAAAASLLYRNAKPKITIFPMQGGVTEMWVGNLSIAGKVIGDRASRLVIAAAGPAAAVLASTAHIGVAHCIKKSHPNLSRYLIVTAIMSLFGHTLYALSALSKRSHSPGHDFAILWTGAGIHPIASVATMVALPIIVKIGLCVHDRMRNQNLNKV